MWACLHIAAASEHNPVMTRIKYFVHGKYQPTTTVYAKPRPKAFLRRILPPSPDGRGTLIERRSYGPVYLIPSSTNWHRRQAPRSPSAALSAPDKNTLDSEYTVHWGTMNSLR